MHTDRAADQIAEQGFAIVPAVVPPALVDRARTTVARLLDDLDVAPGDNVFLGHHTRRIFNLLARDPVFAELVLLDPLLDVVERVLGPGFLLSSLTAVSLGPGETPQPLHADDGSIPLARPHEPIVCVAMVALTDFTEDNGATTLVPGSHRFDRRPRRGERCEVVTATMPAGSALVYAGSLWHGGGANRTSRDRVGVVVNCCAGWVRQEECQLLALPPALVAGFPRRLQELVGYCTYKGLIGHVDQQNPATLLDPGATTDLVWSRFG